MLLFDMAKAGTPLLTRAFMRPDLLLPPPAKSRLGVSLPAVAFQFGPSSILHSISQTGPATSCLQFSLESMSSLRMSSHLGLSVLTGAWQLDPPSLAMDFANLRSPVLAQSFCRLSSLFVLESSFLEISSSVRFVQKELVLFSTGSACFGSATSALSFSSPDLTSSVQSLSWLDSSFSSIYSAHADVLLPLRCAT